MTDQIGFVPPWSRIHDACQAFINTHRTDNEDGAAVQQALAELRSELVEPSADRDTVRDKITDAMQLTVGHFGAVLDAVMAVVDPIVRSRDAYGDERDFTQTERDQARRGEKNAWENCHQTEDHLAELYDAAGIAPETLIEDAGDALRLLRWLHAEAVWQQGIASEALRAAALCLWGQRDSVAEALDVDPGTSMDGLLRGIGDLRESRFRWAEEAAHITAERDNWKQAYELKLADFVNETRRTSAALAACHRDSAPHPVVGEELLGYWMAQEDIQRAVERAGQPAKPCTEVQIELRDWITLGETIADDQDEYARTPFVAASDIHEIIAAYLVANAITPAWQQLAGAGGVALIADKRRSVTKKGFTPEHDDQHRNGQLLDAAHCYANQGRTWFPEFTHKHGTDPGAMLDQNWPWWTGEEPEGWHPSTDPVENLIEAGQLIAAEIDRLQRAAAVRP